MDNWILQLEDITVQVVAEIEFMPYEDLESFVAQRQLIIDEIESALQVSVLDTQQKKRLAQILQYDNVILQRMTFLKNEAEFKMQQRNQAKVQRTAYENHYTSNAILMDQRK